MLLMLGFDIEAALDKSSFGTFAKNLQHE